MSEHNEKLKRGLRMIADLIAEQCAPAETEDMWYAMGAISHWIQWDVEE
jgi:hypothetical protein